MTVLTWDEFVINVEEWAEARGIYTHSTPDAQLLKALSELGEVADAIIKNDMDALEDGLGDTAVCLVNYAKMLGIPAASPNGYVVGTNQSISIICGYIGGSIINLNGEIYMPITALSNIAENHNLDFMTCCTRAWNAIKDRKGRMVPGGAFVKEQA